MTKENFDQTPELLQTILNLLPIGVFWKDKNLKYLGGNEAFAKCAGFNRVEDLIGKDDLQMNWKEHAEGYRLDDQRVILSAKAMLNIEEATTNPQGDKIWVKASKVPLTDTDGNILGILGIVEDITELKNAERQILDKMNYAQKLLSASPSAIFTYKATGECISANEAAAKLVGTTLENVIKQNFYKLDSWKNSGMLECAQKALTTGQEQLLEFHTTSTYGNSFWISARFVPFNFEGEAHLLLMGKDISERKEMENNLKQKITDLEKMNSFMIERELRVIELKKEVNQLCMELNRPLPYGVGTS